MNRTWKAFALGTTCLLLAASSPGATMTYVGATGGSWHDPANWEISSVPAGRVPDGNDVILLQGRTVHVTAAATLKEFGSGTSSGGTVQIDDGGSFAGTGAYSVRYVGAINANAGGTLVMGSSWLIRSTINVNAGGTASGGGGIPQAESKNITVNGTWSPRGTAASAGTSFSVGSLSTPANYIGKVRLQSTGTIILDVFANGSSEYFSVIGRQVENELTLNAGSVQLRPQGGYVPQPGHTFTLWTLASGSLATMNIGNGSNISILGSPYLLDTSRWVAEGVVTVVKPASPGTVMLVY